MGLDPGSEIRDPEKTYSGSRIPDPWVKKATDPGSGSAKMAGALCKFHANARGKHQYSANYTYFITSSQPVHFYQ